MLYASVLLLVISKETVDDERSLEKEEKPSCSEVTRDRTGWLRITFRGSCW